MGHNSNEDAQLLLKAAPPLSLASLSHGRCLTLNQTVGPSILVLSSHTGSSNPGSPLAIVFHIVFHPRSFIWGFRGLNVGPSVHQACGEPLNYGSAQRVAQQNVCQTWLHGEFPISTPVMQSKENS